MDKTTIKTDNFNIGVAGCGALGSIVIKALQDGINGYTLVAVSDITAPDIPSIPCVDFATLADKCDIVVECLPPAIVPDLAQAVLSRNKDMIMISACALLLYPEIKRFADTSNGRIMVPSGALSGLDAVSALSCTKIESAKIASTKPPQGFEGAPFIVANAIDLNRITTRTKLFSGNAYDAAKAFPANVNVAASLSLAGIGPEKTMVEVWADPQATGNSHEITVKGGSSTITSRVDNAPDPDNPKSSMLAGYSIIAALKKRTAMMTVV